MSWLSRQLETRPWLVLVALAAAFLIGLQLGTGPRPASGDEHDHQEELELWTCSMHPQIRQPEPGQCPICGMDLVPLEGGQAGLEPDQLQMTETAKRLAEVRTTKVERRYVTNTVRLKGQVTYDETLLETLTAWVPGRLDELYVDYVGVPVDRGQHLAQMYSPEIFVAERELQQAAAAYREAKEKNYSRRAVESAREILEATREKLRLWGLAESLISRIEQGQKPTDRIDITSPVGGIVVDKKVTAGEYVDTGTPLYSIARLDEVWVVLEAYESDLPWLRYGQTVRISVPSLPGEILEGTISLIDPMVDPKTRTVRVRVDVPNPRRRLKPGMLATGEVRSRLASNDQVLVPELAGKWISPMHPEIVKDGPGFCDICGMPLVPSEEFGFASAESGNPPLVVPASAILFTGKRSIVYVEVPNTDKPTYELREVELGARADDEYIVLGGLEAGEAVVTNGNFKIDSAMQLQARASMMSRQGEGAAAQAAAVPAGFLAQFNPLLQAYLGLQRALSSDDFEAAEQAGKSLAEKVRGLDPAALDSSGEAFWEVRSMSLEKSLDSLAEADSIEKQRQAFYDLSDQVIELAARFGHTLDTSLVVAHCPMAFDSRGADWLQSGGELRNPYFGSKMPSCGEVERRLEPSRHSAEAPAAHQGHQH